MTVQYSPISPTQSDQAHPPKRGRGRDANVSGAADEDELEVLSVPDKHVEQNRSEFVNDNVSSRLRVQLIGKGFNDRCQVISMDAEFQLRALDTGKGQPGVGVEHRQARSGKDGQLVPAHGFFREQRDSADCGRARSILDAERYTMRRQSGELPVKSEFRVISLRESTGNLHLQREQKQGTDRDRLYGALG